MPGRVIGTSMSMGWAGTQSRSADAIIQNRIASAPIAFGTAVKVTDKNQWAPVATGDTEEVVAGVAVREVIQANTYDPQSNPDYVVNVPCDVMVRGNCIVKCQRGTPVAGTAVYVRITANGSHKDAIVGGFEADADDKNTIKVTNIEWTTGVVDSNGCTEITIKTRAKG